MNRCLQSSMNVVKTSWRLTTCCWRRWQQMSGPVWKSRDQSAPDPRSLLVPFFFFALKLWFLILFYDHFWKASNNTTVWHFLSCYLLSNQSFTGVKMSHFSEVFPDVTVTWRHKIPPRAHQSGFTAVELLLIDVRCAIYTSSNQYPWWIKMTNHPLNLSFHFILFSSRTL